MRPAQENDLIQGFRAIEKEWTQQKIPEYHRDLFKVYVGKLQTPQACSVIDAEIADLRAGKALVQLVLSAIQCREYNLGAIVELLGLYGEGQISIQGLISECTGGLLTHRLLTLNTILSIVAWREPMLELLVRSMAWVPGRSLPFLYEGLSYMEKLKCDLDFLKESAIAGVFNFGSDSDPLLLAAAGESTGRVALPIAESQLERVDAAMKVLLSEFAEHRLDWRVGLSVQQTEVVEEVGAEVVEWYLARWLRRVVLETWEDVEKLQRRKWAEEWAEEWAEAWVYSLVREIATEEVRLARADFYREANSLIAEQVQASILVLSASIEAFDGVADCAFLLLVHTEAPEILNSLLLQRAAMEAVQDLVSEQVTLQCFETLWREYCSESFGECMRESRDEAFVRGEEAQRQAELERIARGQAETELQEQRIESQRLQDLVTAQESEISRLRIEREREATARITALQEAELKRQTDLQAANERRQKELQEAEELRLSELQAANNLRLRESREAEEKLRQAREREAAERRKRELQEAETRDRELQAAETREMKVQDAESKERELQEAETRDMELQAAETREMEVQDAESKERELQEAEVRSLDLGADISNIEAPQETEKRSDPDHAETPSSDNSLKDTGFGSFFEAGTKPHDILASPHSSHSADNYFPCPIEPRSEEIASESMQEATADLVKKTEESVFQALEADIENQLRELVNNVILAVQEDQKIEAFALSLSQSLLFTAIQEEELWAVCELVLPGLESSCISAIYQEALETGALILALAQKEYIEEMASSEVVETLIVSLIYSFAKETMEIQAYCQELAGNMINYYLTSLEALPGLVDECLTETDPFTYNLPFAEDPNLLRRLERTPGVAFSLVPMNIEEQHLSDVLTSYYQRIPQEIRELLEPPALQILSMKKGNDPQWLWVVGESQIVGLVGFLMSDPLVICRHVSSLTEVLYPVVLETLVKHWYAKNACTDFRVVLVSSSEILPQKMNNIYAGLGFRFRSANSAAGNMVAKVMGKFLTITEPKAALQVPNILIQASCVVHIADSLQSPALPSSYPEMSLVGYRLGLVQLLLKLRNNERYDLGQGNSSNLQANTVAMTGQQDSFPISMTSLSPDAYTRESKMMLNVQFPACETQTMEIGDRTYQAFRFQSVEGVQAVQVGRMQGLNSLFIVNTVEKGRVAFFAVLNGLQEELQPEVESLKQDLYGKVALLLQGFEPRRTPISDLWVPKFSLNLKSALPWMTNFPLVRSTTSRYLTDCSEQVELQCANYPSPLGQLSAHIVRGACITRPFLFGISHSGLLCLRENATFGPPLFVTYVQQENWLGR